MSVPVVGALGGAVGSMTHATTVLAVVGEPGIDRAGSLPAALRALAANDEGATVEIAGIAAIDAAAPGVRERMPRCTDRGLSPVVRTPPQPVGRLLGLTQLGDLIERHKACLLYTSDAADE